MQKLAHIEAAFDCKRNVSFRLFGFAFWQAWWMLAMCTDIVLPQRSQPGQLFNAFFLITIATTASYLLVVLASRRFGVFGANPVFYPITAALASLGSFCFVVFNMFLYSGLLHPLFFVGVVLFSLGNAFLLIMWGELWSRLATDRVCQHLYASYAFAFAIYFAVRALPSAVGSLVVCLLPILSTVILWSSRNEKKRAPSQIDSSIESIPILRIAITLVSVGAVHGFTQRYLNVSGLLSEDIMSQSLFIAGTGFLMLVLYMIIFQPKDKTVTLFRPILPAFTIGLILLSLLSPEFLFVGHGLVLLAIYNVDILVMITTTDIAFRTRQPVALCFGLGVFGMRLGTTIASALVYWLISNGFLANSTSHIAFCCGACIIIVVGTLVFGPIDFAKLYKPLPPNPANTTVEENCERIAEACGLTPRESEVLLLLAGGRNVPYIMEKLHIAESTAKHHVSNIYRKVGVGNRQGLMDVVLRGMAGKGATE